MNRAKMSDAFLPYFQPSLGAEERREVLATLDSGWLTLGPRTIAFEKQLAEYTGAKQAVAVNSCTAALHLSLLALGIGEGDEVITSPFTFASTGNVIAHTRARPVFCDIETQTYNLDQESLVKSITPRTKAILPVHYGGQPCDLDACRKIAVSHRLSLIEDAAHAIGAEYRGKKLGTFSQATCFSFYATKNMTTGEGGAVTTDDEKLADWIRVRRLHGISRDAWKRYAEKGGWYYEIEDDGWKYNMTDLQAAIGIPQLKKLDGFIAQRRRYASYYNRELAEVGGLILPTERPEVKHTYHLYPILLEKYDRSRFIDQMSDLGIGTSVHFIPLHLHPYYQRTFGYKPGDFPRAEWVYQREVSLPLYPKMKEADLDRVIRAVKKILGA